MVVLCCIVVVTGFLPFPVSRSSLSSPPSQVLSIRILAYFFKCLNMFEYSLDRLRVVKHCGHTRTPINFVKNRVCSTKLHFVMVQSTFFYRPCCIPVPEHLCSNLV